MICLRLAAIELGKPMKRSISGNRVKNITAIKHPQSFLIPPIITIERIKIDSATVKLVGSTYEI